MCVGGKKLKNVLGGKEEKLSNFLHPQAVMTKVKGNWFKSAAVNTWMKLLKTPLFTTRTVDELLWGYEDSLLARAASSDRTVEKVFGLMYKARAFLPQLSKSCL